MAPFRRDQLSDATRRAKLLQAGLDGRIEPVNASALIFDDAGRYLLHLRDNYPDIWRSVGGPIVPSVRNVTISAAQKAR
ncbi:hypothetical protein OOK58_57140 [Streptomyces sp. NBC_01728]|uniref:hypothetical protein n=1 Tax=unclassified Streptomyces TaxID=2593676 RepID=UPI00225577B9|nr:MULTISPECIES: hypothetical protein [unclassified Streptomyces]MCX4460158.1 hypothetical protein [Streptomyces sp. NBC_01719]MCX4500511.1 hypothetical protein [Streptomyces sp. NBC_01728]